MRKLSWVVNLATDNGVSYVCKNGPDHEGPCYKYMTIKVPKGVVTSFSTMKFVVMVGFAFGLTVAGVIGENSIPVQWTIKDVNGTDIDEYAVYAADYIATPASGQVVVSNPDYKKHLIPPGGGIVQVTGLAGGGAGMFVECATINDAMALV